MGALTGGEKTLPALIKFIQIFSTQRRRQRGGGGGGEGGSGVGVEGVKTLLLVRRFNLL